MGNTHTIKASGKLIHAAVSRSGILFPHTHTDITVKASGNTAAVSRSSSLPTHTHTLPDNPPRHSHVHSLPPHKQRHNAESQAAPKAHGTPPAAPGLPSPAVLLPQKYRSQEAAACEPWFPPSSLLLLAASGSTRDARRWEGPPPPAPAC